MRSSAKSAASQFLSIKLRKTATALCLGFCLLPGASGFAQNEATNPRQNPEIKPLMLWFPVPAEKWTDALPVGNGRLGAMIFGRPQHERLQLNDITVWSGGPQPDANRPNAYLALPEIRAALAKGDYATAQKLVAANMTTTGEGDSAYDASYETLGDLTLESSLGSGPVSNYWRWLDIATAVSGVEFTADGKTYRREAFSSAPDHVLVTHLTCDHPRPDQLHAEALASGQRNHDKRRERHAGDAREH